MMMSEPEIIRADDEINESGRTVPGMSYGEMAAE
jgi:hypothetical protein